MPKEINNQSVLRRIDLTEKSILCKTVAELIQRRIEGTHWDFKKIHHEDKYDLIHDVLCLANAKHRGRRFLIFGVNDDDYSLNSIVDTDNRRKQSDIAGLFRDNAAKFFQSRFPDFYLSEIVIEDTVLNVLVIEDTRHKPYYLTDRIREIKPHHIYTRICDTNTPKKDTAPPDEIERMWRERFGLDCSPLERVKILLRDHQHWKSYNLDGKVMWYHEISPEFTLRVEDAEESEGCDHEWTRGETSRRTNCCYYAIFYHGTMLARKLHVGFDDDKKSMIAPCWKPIGKGRFYYYERDSIEEALQIFASAKDKDKDHSKTLRIGRLCESKTKGRARACFGPFLRIPVVSESELCSFLRSLDGDADTLVEPSSSESEQYEVFLRNQILFEERRKARG